MDGKLELLVPKEMMKNCVSSQCVIVAVGGGSYYTSWNAPASEHVASRIDNVYVYADVLTAEQLDTIAGVAPAGDDDVSGSGLYVLQEKYTQCEETY